MRKFVILALAAVFVVAMATYTLATEFKFGGSYRMRGIYWDTGVNEDQTAATGDRGKDLEGVDYYDTRLRLDMMAKVTDKLSAHIQADSGLGYAGDYRYHNPLATQDSYDGVLGHEYGALRGPMVSDPLGGLSAGSTVLSALDTHDIVFQRAYLKYESPFGTLKAGRQWAHWGLGILESMNRNRVEFMHETPTYFLGVGLDKAEEGTLTMDNDDLDRYFVCMGYTGEDLQMGVRSEWERVNVEDAAATSGGLTNRDLNLYAVDWFWKLRAGNLTFNGEYCYKWGRTGVQFSGRDQVDLSAHGLTADACYNLGTAKIGTQFGYFSGDGNPDDASYSVYMTPYNFNPFLLVGEVPINGLTLTGRRVNQTGTRVNTAGTTFIGAYHDDGWNGNYLANLWFIRAYGECSPTKNTSLTTAVGYARANQAINRPGGGVDGALSRGESIGTEIDVTGTYKLADNLSYTTAFGYLFTGGFWDSGSGSPTTLGLTDTADNSFVFLHQIAITF